MRLFILEADDEVRDVLGSTFRFAGHDVALARTGIEALLRIGIEWTPDLVLIDDASKGARSLEQALREEPTLMDIPTLHFASERSAAAPIAVDGLEHVFRRLEELRPLSHAA